MVLNKIKMLVVSLMVLAIYPAVTWASLSQTQVSQLYVSIFGRASEGEGNQYWQSKNWDMATTATKMLDTDAAKNYFGDSLATDQAFIEYIYKNTLNKTMADDPDGIAYWVGQLKTQSKGQVVSKLVDTILQYGPGQPYYSPNDTKANQAYEQFYNRVQASNHMAVTVENTPDNWEVVTVFSKGLNVTYDQNTLTVAIGRINDLGAHGSDTALAQKIRQKMVMLCSVANMAPTGDMDAVQEELQQILQAVMRGDSSIVTVTPPLNTLNMDNIPSKITIAFDFGAGYSPESTDAVYTGSGSMVITDLVVSAETFTGSANVTFTANNVKRDGTTVLNGGGFASLNVRPSDSGDIGITLNTTFNGLKVSQDVINGAANLSATLSMGQGSPKPGSILVQFDGFGTLDEQVSGSVTLTPKSETIYEVNADLTTSKGPIAGIVTMEQMADDSVKITTPSGPFHIEDLDMTITSPLILDGTQTSCEGCIPAQEGEITITDGQETVTVQFNGCDYSIQ